MHDRSLAGLFVLLIEDEYLIADNLASALRKAGAEVIGPAPTVAQALPLIQNAPKIDIAILDVNLGGEHAWPIVETLASRAIPLLLVTGYDELSLPPQFRNVVRLGKPVDAEEVVAAASKMNR